MKCRYCGSEIKGNVKFCAECGRQISDDVLEPEEEKKEIKFSSGIENAARSALGSFWVLFGMIFLFAQVALMVFYTFFCDISQVLDFLGRLFFYQENALLYLRIVVALVAAVELIVLLGFLLTYISALRNKARFNCAGLSILEALCVIGLILVCFIGLCGIGAGLVGLRYLRHYTYISLEGVTTGQIVYVSCMAACLLIFYILMIIFFAKLISSIGRAKRAAAEGIARKNIAFYNAVMLFFIALCIIAFCAASLLTSAPSEWIIVTGELSLCASCVMFAFFIISYRRKMKEFL